MQGKQRQEGDLVKFSISRASTTLPWGAGGPGIAGMAGIAGIRETLSAVPAASLQKARWLCACVAHARGSVDGRSVRGHGRAFASLGGCGR